MKNIFRILSINLIIFITILIILEAIFGYWFKENNFGYFLRKERLKKAFYETSHDEKSYKYYYKRNFYGFRGDDVDPEKIKIVFHGGSTGNQRYTPENLTIVGLLNKEFKKDNLLITIHNASTDGKTSRGYNNDFKYWFSKIPNFKPDVFIFFVGINDSHIDQPKRFDIPYSNKVSQKIIDYIKNNSIFVELLKDIKFKYFTKIKISYDVRKNNPIQNINFINYTKAKKLFENTIDNDGIIIQYKKRLGKLNENIKLNNIHPIFITQIKYNGISEKNLFFVNEYTKKFAEINDYNIIKLDELVDNLSDTSYFYDNVHTTVKGTEYLFNLIYPLLKQHIINFNEKK